MKVKNILRGVIATVMTLIIILNLASCDVAEIVEGLMDNIDDKVENDMIDMDDFEDTAQTPPTDVPYILLDEDYNEMVAIIKQNMETKISNGEITADEAPVERHRFLIMQAYYGRYIKAEAVNPQMYDMFLENHPILAVTDGIFVLDAASMSDETIAAQLVFITEYGITENHLRQYARNIEEEINNSDAENKEEILASVESYKK